MSTKSIFYIGTGEKHMMYTLRHRYPEAVWTRGAGGEPVSFTVVRDLHVKNLSTDRSEAIAKAVKYCEEGNNRTLWKDSIDRLEELNDIKRRSEEELATLEEMEHERQRKLDELREEKFQDQMTYWIEEAADGRFPFGKYKGHNFSDWLSYCGWMVKRIEESDKEDPMTMRFQAVNDAIVAYLKIHHPAIFELPTPNNEFVGEIKKRQDFEGQCIRTTWYETMYGITNIYNIVLTTGELVVIKATTALDIDCGDKVKFKATVKEHSEYKGQNQTLVNRAKLIE